MGTNKRIPCLLLVLGFVLLISVVSCDHNSNNDSSSNSVNVLSKDDKDISNVARQVITKCVIMLTLNFNYLLAHEKLELDNIMFAPINIVKTLATILLGAAGETETELVKALSWISGTDFKDKLEMVHQILGLLMKEMAEHPGAEIGTNLRIAGAVFAQKGYEIKPKYVELVRSIYDTEVITLDFARNQAEATKEVNKWVNDKTFGKIKKLFTEPIPSNTLVLPTGCLYFNGDWEYPFEQKFTNKQPFYLSSKGRASKKKVIVKMMVNTATIPYYENRILSFQSIGIPYKGKDMYMYILLPKLNFDLNKFAVELSFLDIKNIIHNSTEVETLYIIPKMVLSAKINLKNAVKKTLDSNNPTLSDPLKANFSNMAKGFYIDDIWHQVEIDVNEIGTVATAATTIIGTRGGINIFRVDRPFLFFIYNIKVNIVTFWGSIYKPVTNNEDL